MSERPQGQNPVEGEPLWRRVTMAPVCADAIVAEARLDELLGRPAATGLRALAEEPQVRRLLLALADHSPFLWRLILADPTRAESCLAAPPEAQLLACLARLEQDSFRARDEAEIMRALRLAKQETALLIALADLGGAFGVVEATLALSRAADGLIAAALGFLLREAHRSGALRLWDSSGAEQACGLAVLGLGKLGARELNYSSDVDLIVVFDPQCPALSATADPAKLFIGVTKRLVRLLQDRTRDGYGLRVDLRLRPDPGSTPVAISLPAAYTYYEVVGQNWERAALIKARPIAGDTSLGERFLANLTPFIWRKYFDYAAIADIQAMKRQIQAYRGHDEIAVAGHDVKLGRGGIREIEFFVQTQQLIFGGKRPWLRGTGTLAMLDALGRDDWVTGKAVFDLTDAYLFLREAEHRLQMIADEQTQRLPRDEEELSRFSRFCGYVREEDFAADLTRHLSQVSYHYARLFEHAAGLDAAAGSLVFTGSSEDPETLETLTRLGFKDPALASQTIRGWHFGHRAAIRTPRAREVLTELVPGLLQAFSASGDPDAALAGLDSALARMPAAVELFTILKSNPSLCELFGEILGGAPRLAGVITRNPHRLDAAIDRSSLAAALDDKAFLQRAGHLFNPALTTEDFLDAARDFGQDEHFVIGLRLFSGMIDPVDAAAAYSALAASLVKAALSHVEQSFSRDHGLVPGGHAAVLALGKLGSHEMTAESDLDLILIYDYDRDHPESDGPRALHAAQYYTRVAQRLVSALTVATRRGRLYEVDMRLRPSGRKGPTATQFDSFVVYQNQDAETWEHMVLTRARVIAGDEAFAIRVSDAIVEVLTIRRDASLRRDVVEMRHLIAEAKGDKNPWDLKLAAGGLIDIEFLAQSLLLCHAHDAPQLVRVSTYAVLEAAGRLGYLDAEDASVLMQAHRLFTNVTQMLRLTLPADADPNLAGEAVKRRLAKVADLPSAAALEAHLGETRARVRACFERLLEAPSRV